MSETSAKAKLRAFFRANVGVVVSSNQLKDIVGPNVSEWARRVRELRDEEEWPIRTQNDLDFLKPGQYLMTDAPPDHPDVSFKRGISARLRAEVLDRNGFTCQMCGLTPGDIDPDTHRTVRLHVGHSVDKKLGGRDELSNLRALCSTCNQGAKNVTSEKPSALWLLSQVRRAGADEQREVYDWLRTKFESA